MRYFLTILLALLLMGASVEDARKANEAYENGNYQQAITLYKKAIDKNPKNPKLYFNLATAQAKAGESQKAIRTFEQYKSMAESPAERAKANYNIGKILSDAQKWEKAVDYYKKALRHIADDADAKHNFELAKKKKKEQKENQQQQQNQQKENSDQQQQNNNQQQQQNQDQQENNNQQQKQDQQNKQNKQNKQQQQQKQSQKMSKAEAEKILQALGQKEKKLLQQFKKQQTEGSKSKNEKDW